MCKWLPAELHFAPDRALPTLMRDPDGFDSEETLQELRVWPQETVRRIVSLAKYRARPVLPYPAAGKARDSIDALDSSFVFYKRLSLSDWMGDMGLLAKWRPPSVRSLTAPFRDQAMLQEFGLRWPAWCGNFRPPAWMAPKPTSDIDEAHIRAWQLRNPPSASGELWFVEVPLVCLHPTWISKEPWAPFAIRGKDACAPGNVLIGYSEVYVYFYSRLLMLFGRHSAVHMANQFFITARARSRGRVLKKQKTLLPPEEPEDPEDWEEESFVKEFGDELYKEPPELAALEKSIRGESRDAPLSDKGLWEQCISSETLDMAEVMPFLPPCMALKMASPYPWKDKVRYEFASYAVPSGMPRPIIEQIFLAKDKKYPVGHLYSSPRIPWSCDKKMRAESGSAAVNCGCPFMDNTGDRTVFAGLLESSLVDIEDIGDARATILRGRPGKTGPFAAATTRCSMLLRLRGAPEEWTAKSPVQWSSMALRLAATPKEPAPAKQGGPGGA